MSFCQGFWSFSPEPLNMPPSRIIFMSSLPNVYEPVRPTSLTLPTCLAMNERLAKYWRCGLRCASMEKGTRICPILRSSPFIGYTAAYASSIFISPSSERSISVLYPMRRFTLPESEKRALRTWKRPALIWGWYSYLPLTTPCISGSHSFQFFFSFCDSSVCCALAVCANAHSSTDIIRKILFMCFGFCCTV